MNKAKEIGQIALWLAGHLAFTVVLNLTILGGYYAHLQYQAVTGTPIDVAELTDDSKQALANALIEDGFSVPRNIDDKPKKRG